MKRTFLIAALCSLAVHAPLPAFAQNGHALGIDTTNFDRSVRPQDDFFRFVNGGWLKRTEIPADASNSNAAAGSEQRKVGDLYASFMDTAAVEKLGITPLKSELATIAAIKSSSDLPAAFVHFSKIGVQTPLGVGVGQDPKRSDVNIVLVSQSGLGMPDRDYYLRQDEKTKATRAAYTSYVTKMLSLAGQPDPGGAAGRILELETAIAAHHWDRARSRDRNATYNKMTMAELTALTPSYSWPAYLKAAGLSNATEV